MDAASVPDFVWRALLYILAGIGLIGVLILWKTGRLQIGDDKKVPHQNRRAVDPLLERLLVQNDDAMNRYIEAMKEISAGISGSVMALRALAAEVQAVASKQDQSAAHNQASFRGVHDRMDQMIQKSA